MGERGGRRKRLGKTGIAGLAAVAVLVVLGALFLLRGEPEEVAVPGTVTGIAEPEAEELEAED